MDLTSFSPSSALITVIVLALAPFVAVMVTSFTKIVVVLSLLRNALGTQQIPPNVVINGLALILTIYVMYPVGQAMTAELAGREDVVDSVDAVLLEREFFLSTVQRMVDRESAQELSSRDFIVIVPAFTVSELTTAFQIGFLIFLPFVIIDLVIANILMAMGMMMLSPTTISLPFKLLLFVLIEGWTKLAADHPASTVASGHSCRTASGGRCTGGYSHCLCSGGDPIARTNVSVCGEVFCHCRHDLCNRIIDWQHAVPILRSNIFNLSYSGRLMNSESAISLLYPGTLLFVRVERLG